MPLGALEGSGCSLFFYAGLYFSRGISLGRVEVPFWLVLTITGLITGFPVKDPAVSEILSYIHSGTYNNKMDLSKLDFSKVFDNN